MCCVDTPNVLKVVGMMHLSVEKQLATAFYQQRFKARSAYICMLALNIEARELFMRNCSPQTVQLEHTCTKV
jgi:hypothetical protein